MKNRINRLARGVYDTIVPDIRICETSIEENIAVDSVFTGELRIFAANNLLVKGIVYSDNLYVDVINCNFSGEDNLIQYKVYASGMNVSDTITGQFDIVSDAGEFVVPFRFTTVEKHISSEIGEMKNMFDFTNYVMTDYEKALKLFASKEFKEIFASKDYSLSSVYDSLIKGYDVRQSLEEFLIYTKKKNKVVISVKEKEKTFTGLSDNLEDYVLIEKDTWGYVKLAITTDADFITLFANNIDSDSFSGNKYELKYLIDIARLHAGRNYGSIYIQTDSQQFQYDITVVKDECRDKEIRRDIKKNICALEQLYLEFRRKEISAKEWLENSYERIDAVRKYDDSNVFLKLYKAQLLLAERKEAQAKWILDSLHEEIVAKKDEDIQTFCYYLYIMSLYSKDRLFAMKATEQIKNYYDNRCSAWQVLWVLLYLDDENDKNKSLKLIRLKEQFYKGCKSPVMYHEAGAIISETPALLRVLDEFEIQVINYGCKHNLMTQKSAAYICDMIKNEKNIKRPHINILMNLYKSFETDEILLTLCEVLVRNNCVGKEYFEWYRLGVLKEHKITKLYEYYVSCIDMESMEILPKQILLYFMFNNSTDYNVKAYVYANVIYNRSEDPKTYEQYSKDIKRFALQQLKLGNISEHLAVIYNDMLSADMISEENIRNLPKILFTYKIKCSVNNVNRVIVRHKEYEGESGFAVNDGVAYVQMYTPGAQVFFELVNAKRYACSIPFKMTRLLDEEKYRDIMYSLYENNINVSLYFANDFLSKHNNSEEARAVYFTIVKDSHIRAEYKEEIIRIIVEYYFEAFDIDSRFMYFVNLVKDIELSRFVRIRILETLISNGEYAMAYQYIKDYHVFPENPKRIYRLTSKLLLSDDKYNDIILKLAKKCLINKKYDDVILSYLTDNYNDSTKNMVELWEYAGKFLAEMYDLEERIIAQSLFTRVHNKKVYTIFEDYCRHGANERVVEAFISYYCYNYFVNETIINEDILKIVEHRYEYGMELLPVLELSLLKMYSKCEEMSEKQKNNAIVLLTKYCKQGMYFEFYKDFLGKITLPYDISDKTFAQYQTVPGGHVTIHYMYENNGDDSNYIVEDMKEAFEGIFVKPFSLFYGQAVQYYVSEVNEDTEKVTESIRLVNTSINPEKTESRFEALNDILASIELKDDITTQKLIHSYVVNEYISDNMFNPL